MDELYAVLALDAELLAFVHAALTALVAAGWRLWRAATPLHARVAAPAPRHATVFTRRAATAFAPPDAPERGPPARV